MRFPLSARQITAAGALLSQLAAAATHHVIELSDQEWTLTSPNHKEISVPGKVPSHAHVDLYAAGVIDDPIAKLNEFDVRWVAYSNWTYSSKIHGLKNSHHAESHIVFNGLDTYASVEFCGKQVGYGENQFRQYVFEITEALKSCRDKEPLLEVKFGAVPNITEAIAKLPGQETWPGNIASVYQFHNRQFVRKQQSDMGWDWGPALVPVGIWQPAQIVQLEGQGSVHVKNSDFDLYRVGQLNNLPPDQSANWVLNASIDAVGNIPRGARMRYTIFHADTGKRVSSGSFGKVENHGDVITGVTTLDASEYELWWPNGMGAQKLYNVKVDVSWNRKKVTTVQKRMGFRTIVINMARVSEKQLSQGIQAGTNWHFEINGKEFYAKGSNMVPPDVFWPRVTRDHVKSLFDSVVEGNQNMLRVWSSGSYAPDFMYDLADEMGLLLWCEFEFSVSLYPADKPFLENVRQEAVYQVRRANHHPSVAVWAGGNEMEKDELPELRDHYKDLYPKYLNEYFELFLNTLLPAVYGNSRSIGYMPCSTNNGYLKLDHSLDIPFVDRLYNATPGELYGDKDFYNYDAAKGFDINTYIVGRFANEFGFPSMPSLESWREAIPEDELYFYSRMTLLRNRHYPPGNLATNNLGPPTSGMNEIVKGVKLWYPRPDKTDSVANFSAWCHATQVYQADYYRSKIQYYRASSGMPQRQLGALYWQLNDIWQAPSWSGIEYDGRWKMMMYAAKDIFQPVIVAPVFNVSSGILTIWAVSDQFDDVKGEVSWDWIGYDGKPVKSVKGDKRKFTVGPVNATAVAELNISELKGKEDFPADNAVLVASITAEGKTPTKTFSHSNFFTATPLSKAKIVDPGLTVKHSDGKFTITAKDGVSAFTWIHPDHKDSGVIVVFDDNGFLLQKGESRTIGYRVVKGSSSGWESRVTVSSVWDNTLKE